MYATVPLAEALGVSDEGLFGLAMLAAFIVGCAAGLLRASNGLVVVLLVSVGAGLFHRYVVSPPAAGPPILPPIVIYVALGMAVLTVALLGFVATKAVRRVLGLSSR